MVHMLDSSSMQGPQQTPDDADGLVEAATLTAFFRQLPAEDEFAFSDILGNDLQFSEGLDMFAGTVAASDSGTSDSYNATAVVATPGEATEHRGEACSSISTDYPQQQQQQSPAVEKAVGLDDQMPDIHSPALAYAAAQVAAPSPASQQGLLGSIELLPRPAAGMAALGRQPSSASTTTVSDLPLQAPSILFGVATPAQAPSESLQRFVVPASPAAAAQHAAAPSGRSASRARTSRRAKPCARTQEANKAAQSREGSPAAAAGGSPSTAAEGCASPLVTLSSSSAGNDGNMRAPQRTNSSRASPAPANTMLEPQNGGSRQQSPANPTANDACAVRTVTALVHEKAQGEQAPTPSPFAAAAAAAGAGTAGISPFSAPRRLQLPTAVPAAAYVLDPAKEDSAPAAVRVPGLQSVPSAPDLASAGLLSRRSSSSMLRLPTLLPPALLHGNESMLHSAFSAPPADGTGLLCTARSMALREAIGRAGSAQLGRPGVLQDSAAALADAAAQFSCRQEAPVFASAAGASAPARAASAPADGAGLGAGLFTSAGQGAWAAGGAGAHANIAPLAALPFLRSNSAAPAGQDVLQALLMPQHSFNLPTGASGALAGTAADGAGPVAAPASAQRAFAGSRKRSAAAASPVAAGGLASIDDIEGGMRSRRRTSMDNTTEAAQVGLAGPALIAQQITELTVLQAQLQRSLAGLHASWVAMQGPQQTTHSDGDAAAEQRHEQRLQQVLQFAFAGAGFMQQGGGV